jgi:purine-binding chemotaxis protein CheW
MSDKRRPGAEDSAPEAKPAIRLPRSGLAEEILPLLAGAAGAAGATAPAGPAAGEGTAPAASEESLAGEERIYAFADRLQAAAPRSEEAPEEPETWVTFVLDGDTFAFPVTHVHEIVRVAGITRVPHAPFPIRGITNLRGQVLPVVDLRLRLGLKAADLGEDSRVLVATSRSRTVGLLVDRVQQVVRLLPSKVQPPPPDVMSEQSEYVRGVYDLGTELAILLEISLVLLIPKSLEPPAPPKSARRKRKD